MALLNWITEAGNLITGKTDFAQSMARIVVACSILIYFLFTGHHDSLEYLAGSYALLAILIMLWIKLANVKTWRRYIVITLDNAMITAGLWMSGPEHLGLFLLYFWVVLGNGYRFGSHYALVASVATMTGAILVSSFSIYWIPQQDHVGEMFFGLSLVLAFAYSIFRKLEDEVELRLASERTAQKYAIKSTRDSLTAVCNRDYIDDWLNEKHRTHARVAVLFLDLDNFKQFNDNYGHHIGDQVLINISKRISNSIRTQDVVCRYAGDEFVILLDDEDEDTICDIANRITSALNQAVDVDDGSRLTVTGSIGIAIMGIHAKTPADTLRCADSAMYMAKRKGRNRAAWYKGKISETGRTDRGQTIRK